MPQGQAALANGSVGWEASSPAALSTAPVLLQLLSRAGWQRYKKLLQLF